MFFEIFLLVSSETINFFYFCQLICSHCINFHISLWEKLNWNECTPELVQWNPRKRLDFRISRGIPLETIWSPHFHICKILRVWYFNFIHYFSVQLDFKDILKIQKIMDPMKTIKSNIHTVSLTNVKSYNILPIRFKNS